MVSKITEKVEERVNSLWLLVFLFMIVSLSLTLPNVAHGASSTPYDVPSSVKNNWNDTLGGKQYSMTSGRDLVYDVYKDKYTSGGYRIVTKDFGKGSQPYLNFQGWAVLFGYKNHYEDNNDTYIVARKSSGDSGIGTVKIYSTLLKNLNATEDLEYNNQGSGLWNPCDDDVTNKRNDYCNMRYEGVGFDAYIPLKELFPDQYEEATWQLFIVKKVDSHIVYSPLILPFEFDNRDYNQGSISLSSGQDAKKLIMNSDGVMRRKYPRQPAPEVIDELGSDRYFDRDSVYTRVDSEESKTAIWYGVKSPKDGNGTRWASTAYWTFGGSQATISYDGPPVHVLDEVLNYRYKNGNDYWFQPNDQGYIRLEQKDEGSGNKYQYLRLLGSGEDVRSRHDFEGSSSNNDQIYTSSHIKINSATREKNSDYGQVKWGIIPYVHGDSFNVEYYYTDKAGNHIGYIDTGKNIRVDGLPPEHISFSLTGYRYKNGSTYWVRPNDSISVSFRQYDPDSGNEYQYLRFSENGNIIARSRHDFDSGSNTNNKQVTSPDISIDSANRTENNSYGTVTWDVTPKSHGHKYAIERYYQDHAENNTGYVTMGTLGVDGQAPLVQFRSSDDTRDFEGRDWGNTPIAVRLKFSDSDSGYDQSRYAWTQTTSLPTSWSDWTTESNYVTSINGYGEWYLHVQAKDKVGNIVDIYKGPYRFNNPPVADFTANPNPTDRLTTVQFTSLSSDPDGNPLTYKWEYQKSGTSSWTQFSTSANPTYKFSTVDTYNIRLTVTDSNGASASVIKSITVKNLPPKADFTVSPDLIYIGDQVTVNGKASDPEGDNISYQYVLKSPSGKETTYNTKDFNFIPNEVGVYNITQKVTDAYGASDSVSKSVTVNDLMIIGHVGHTETWKNYHMQLGHDDDMFYSGEKFLLSAEVTDHPIQSVSVSFTGLRVDGSQIKLNSNLQQNSNVLYTGEIFDRSMSDPQQKLENGTVYFLFTATWKNGITRTDLVPVQIIDDAYNAFQFHQTN